MKKNHLIVCGECEDCVCNNCARRYGACPMTGGCKECPTFQNENFCEACDYEITGPMSEADIVQAFCRKLKVGNILDTFEVPTDTLLNTLESLNKDDRHIIDKHMLSLTRH